MVDIFCGPSTGSILNAALNIPSKDDPTKPKFRARHMVRFYEREGKKIFPADRFRELRGFFHDFNNRTVKLGQLNALMRHGHYNRTHFEKCLRDLYGDTKLGHSLSDLVIPVYNIDNTASQRLEHSQSKGEKSEEAAAEVRKNNFYNAGGSSIWLKNIRNGRNLKPTPDVEIFDAVLASCAAPSYFPSHSFPVHYPDKNKAITYTGIDGSIFDNPYVSYHGALKPHLEPNENTIIIAIGTGFVLQSISKDKWDSFGGLGVVDPVNDLPLIQILFHATETALLESFTEEMGDTLYNFNKPIDPEAGRSRGTNTDSSPNRSIDDASPENLKAMGVFAHEMLEDNHKQFDEICDHLVRARDSKEREKHSMWHSMKTKFFFK